jgi:prepilin-type N-terminal cleavage/methylation domain-containing protein
MSTSAHDTGSEQVRRGREAGFTMSELLVVVAIVGILSAIASGEFLNYQERARLAACMVNMRQIQRTIFQFSEMGTGYISPDELWEVGWYGRRPKGFHYLIDNGDANAGHGNDLDGYDEHNPGSVKPEKDIHFVLLCDHDHGSLGRYVYLEDENPPRIATTGKDDPKYQRFLNMFGGSGGTGGGGPGSEGGPGGGQGGGKK